MMFNPVKSQQRPEDCWSVMPFDFTTIENSVSTAVCFSWFSASDLMLFAPMALRMALSEAVFR